MSRKKSLLMMAIALLGAGVTVFLSIVLLGGSAEGVRGRSPAYLPGGGPFGGPGSGEGGKVHIQEMTEAKAREAARFGNGTANSGRVPYDSPETLAQMADDKRRVFDLLDAIQGQESKDPAARVAHYRELQDLIRRLGSNVDPAVRGRLMLLLQQVEEKWRALLGDTLGSFHGDRETAEALMELLESRPENVYTRNAIFIALGKLQVKETVPALLAMLGTGHESENLIVRTIGQVGGSEAAQALLARLGQPILAETQREIERVLGEVRDPAVLAKVREGLAEANARVRNSYLSILAMTRDATHAPAVHKMLEDETDSNVRKNALRTLGMFGDAESGRVLLSVLQTGREEERADAIRAIHHITEPATVERLAQDWDHFNDEARIAVMGAAARLSRPPASLMQLAVDSLREPNERIHNFAAQMLGQAGREESVEPLTAFLFRSENSRERSVAVSALIKVGTLSAAEGALRAIQAFPDERQREAYRRTFEKIRDKHLALQQER